MLTFHIIYLDSLYRHLVSIASSLPSIESRHHYHRSHHNHRSHSSSHHHCHRIITAIASSIASSSIASLPSIALSHRIIIIDRILYRIIDRTRHRIINAIASHHHHRSHPLSHSSVSTIALVCRTCHRINYRTRLSHLSSHQLSHSSSHRIIDCIAPSSSIASHHIITTIASSIASHHHHQSHRRSKRCNQGMVM